MLARRFTKSSILKNITKCFSGNGCPVMPGVTKEAMSGCPISGITLAVRQPAPEFKGQAWWNGEFKEISLEAMKGKWVCLFFYPLNFTFVCPTEIVEFNSKSEEFANMSKFEIYLNIH